MKRKSDGWGKEFNCKKKIFFPGENFFLMMAEPEKNDKFLKTKGNNHKKSFKKVKYFSLGT